MRWLAILLVFVIAGCAATEPAEPEVTDRGLLEKPKSLLGPGDVLLLEPVRFTDLRGGDVLADPAVYHVEAHRSGGLLLVPADHAGQPLLIKAAPPVPFSGSVREPWAKLIRKDIGEVHLVLLATNGKHYEAAGYVGDVRPRGAPQRISAARLKAARAPQASLVVTAPKAKQKLQAGRSTTIRWKKQGQQHAQVSITLMKGRRLVQSIASRAKNSGAFGWKVPADLPSATYWLAIATRDRRVRAQSGQFSVVGTARTATTGRFDTAQIKFSRQPKRLVKTAAEAPKGGATPPPLTSEERAAAIRQVRILAEIHVTPQLPQPLTEVTLTADKPRVGKCWYDVRYGWNFPGGSDTNPPIHSTIRGYWKNSKYVFHLEPVVPGKTYLVDCTVVSTPQTETGWDGWIVSGAFEGTLTQMNGHLLFGFTATSSTAEFELAKRYTYPYTYGLLFGVELTRVD